MLSFGVVLVKRCGYLLRNNYLNPSKRVAPPPTGLFAPPTIDLSNSSLEEFKRPKFKGYEVKVNKSVSENSSNEIKKTSGAPIIEDWISDCDEDETLEKVSESANVQKPKQADQPRKISQNPRNNSTNWNTPMSKKLGVGFQFTPKALVFVSSECWLYTTQQMVINLPCLIDKKELAIPGQTTTGISKEVGTTKVLRSVVPLTKVGDVVHKKLGDRMERATTTASSVEAEQHNDAQTRFEAASKSPMIHLSQEVTYLDVMRAGKEELKNIDTKLCTKLFEKVTSLEQDLKQTKQVYGKALTKLVKKVKHLENQLKSTTKRKKAKVVISHEEEDLVSKDPSKQGRMSKTKYGDVETQKKKY
ncbi:hypothetical protein Tco_0300475 [Tanacetum coccineum]